MQLCALLSVLDRPTFPFLVKNMLHHVLLPERQLCTPPSVLPKAIVIPKMVTSTSPSTVTILLMYDQVAAMRKRHFPRALQKVKSNNNSESDNQQASQAQVPPPSTTLPWIQQRTKKASHANQLHIVGRLIYWIT